MKSIKYRPVIGISMGDPLGIGPEILVKALAVPRLYTICRPFILGDGYIIAKACDLLSQGMAVNKIADPGMGRYEYGYLDLLAVSDLSSDITGLTSPNRETGAAMEGYITKGATLALDGRIDALVTGPIHKTGLKKAGSKFHGHTELLANLTQSSRFAMMMAGERLKVVLVTIHLALKDVGVHLTREKIIETALLTHTALKNRFNIPNPRLAVAGLNPHAGEETLFGMEEQTIISPAVQAVRDKGILIEGPLPPDTVFYQAANQKFDAVISMYHDQGLIPFKMLHFKDGVNTTLGLPIIRTSVDHGTAYDIAWKGKADPSSLEAAIRMAVLQACNRKAISKT